MKTITDPRHQKRRRIIQKLFALSFSPQPKSSPLTRQLKENLPKIDKIITKNAPTFALNKINKVDLAILRLAIFELMQKSAPAKVVIDEAVELAKEFGGQASFSFVNGVLGTVLKSL